MKVFKNPNRGKNHHIAVEKYEPEYIRLNKEPVIAPVSREEFRRPAPKFSVPPIVKVNSGQNMEAGWMQVEEPVNSPKIPATVAQTQRRPHSGLKSEPTEQITHKFTNTFYNEPLESSAVPDFSSKMVENIRDEDIQLPPNEVSEFNDGDSEDENLNFSNLNIGEYVLIYNNDVLASGELEDITNLMEDVLTSEKYNVEPEHLVVLKKMNFRTGVLICD